MAALLAFRICHCACCVGRCNQDIQVLPTTLGAILEDSKGEIILLILLEVHSGWCHWSLVIGLCRPLAAAKTGTRQTTPDSRAHGVHVHHILRPALFRLLLCWTCFVYHSLLLFVVVIY
jgi:hypothetical protein